MRQTIKVNLLIKILIRAAISFLKKYFSSRHSKVDNFQIHGGVLYCQYHFKQRFGQKDGVAHAPEQVRREEIRSDAVKTRSDKTSTTKVASEELQHSVGAKRGATVLSKMEK